MNLTFRVTLHNVPELYLSEDVSAITMIWVKQKLQEIAEGLEGNLHDVEMG
jgi:hypothetical protein